MGKSPERGRGQNGNPLQTGRFILGRQYEETILQTAEKAVCVGFYQMRMVERRNRC